MAARKAACALLRRSTASASLSRATPAQIVVPRPLLPQSPALSARGFHAVAKSGQRRPDTVLPKTTPMPPMSSSAALLPARRHGHIAAKNTMENSSVLEEKKAALLQALFKEEASAAARKRNQMKLAELEKRSLTADEEMLDKEMKALKEASKAKTEELLAVIGRKGASGVDQEALMLARVAQAGQDIQDLKSSVTCLNVCLAVLGVATAYNLFS